MNTTKTKDVFTDRDQLRANNAWLTEQVDVLTRENESLRKVADAVVAVEIASRAESKLQRICPPSHIDHDTCVIVLQACEILLDAEEAAKGALDAAVAGYRLLAELSPFFERPGVKAGLAGCDRMEHLQGGNASL